MGELLGRLLWPARSVRWLVWAGAMIVWSTALLLPVPVTPAVELGGQDLKFYLSKLLHLAAYVVLTVLAAWLKAPTRHRWLLLFLLIVHAATMELLQWLMQLGRDGTIRDVLLNLAGVAVGCALTWRSWRPMARLRTPT